uniref:glucuronosyltransferase n=1 Tax=Caenorhabditis japonica TaxID=281687 RepID=A0A8R1DPH4_CAEJA
MKTILPFIFSVLLFLPSVSSLNYLVFCPLYAHSHHKFLAKIADTLTDAGHNVTFLAPIIMRKYEHVKYLESTKEIIYIQPDEELEKMGDSNTYPNFWVEDASIFGMIPVVRGFLKMFHNIYEHFKRDKSVLDELKERKFDALIFELLCPTAYPIGEYIGVKAMLPTLSMTHHTYWSRYIGEPSPPSALPSMVSPFGNDQSFQERVISTLADLLFLYLVDEKPMYSYIDPQRQLDVEKESVHAPFVFLNANPYMDFPRPLLTKSILIGGISINATQMRQEKLEKEYVKLLEKREKNVLISFGSFIYSKDMPDSFKNTIIRVIESFPNVTFIWKYETEDVSFARNLKNLHFSKWVPQTALLADSRLSAFITHAGLGSVNELSYMGKPAILIPIFADQMRNAKMLVRHKGSILLDKRSLADFEKLREAVKAILEDESYRNHAETLGKQLEQQPISPHDLLVKHAEFGAKFGELPALDPYSRQMSYFTFYLIDIILFFSFLTIVLIFALFSLFKFLAKSVLKPKAKIQ